MKQYLVFDIGCLECGESSKPVGLFSTQEEAQAAIDRYVTNEPGTWGRAEWKGQHCVEIFEL